MKSANEKIFYHIYPLGFCGAPHKNSSVEGVTERILKIIDWIPHMKYLGVNALYLGPVFESVEHGYDTVDYYRVDKRLGTNESLKYVISKLHENGIEVILDGVFNHVGREFFAFKDLQSNRENSRYVNWFDGIDFSKRSPYNDSFGYNNWAGHFSLVKLNLKNRETEEYLINAAKFWIDEFDIDGIRLDAADTLDFNFMKKLSVELKNKKQDFWLMGEVVHGDYRRWVNEGGLDCTTNYECYKGLYSSHNDKNYFEIAYSLKREFGENGVYRDIPMYNFADNHDVDRVTTSINKKAHLYPLYTILFAMPGVPSVYYGSEWKIEGHKGGYNDLEIRPALEIGRMNSEYETDLIGYIATLSKIKRQENTLKYGSYKEIFVKSEQFGFEREYQNETVNIMVNSSDNEVTVNDIGIKNGKYYDLMKSEEIEIWNNSVILEGNSEIILKRI